MCLRVIGSLGSPECSTVLMIITLMTPRVFWKSSCFYAAYISSPHSPICSVCSLRNNSRCFPFTLSKYQTDLDIYICLMKYTFSLTVPKWLIYCYVMISIKISSRHKREMLSLIAVWSEECFLHRNKWCMLTSQFSVKPGNRRLFLERKEITFEVFSFFFFFSLP